ncbi:MAG: glutamate--tRNA ligase, partial [Pseudomonadota bacterium]|nr:glutamate--tRNA ligase [Pseudomonadota bacterium]
NFDLTHLNNSPASFNTQKLDWVNQHYLKTLPPQNIAPQLAWQFTLMNIDTQNGPALADIITAQAERCKTLKEMAEKSAFFFQDIKEYDAAAVEKNLNSTTLPLLQHLHTTFSELSEWTPQEAHAVVANAAETLNLKLGQVAQPLRVAITGGSVSPSIDVTLSLLGKKVVLARIEDFKTLIESAK